MSHVLLVLAIFSTGIVSLSPRPALANTVYSSGQTGQEMIFAPSGTPMEGEAQAYYSCTSSFCYFPTTETFYTLPASTTVDRIRIKRISGNSCATIFSNFAYFGDSSGSGRVGTAFTSSYEDHAPFCDLILSTPVTSGNVAILFASYAGIVLDGSLSNPGAMYDAHNNRVHLGGPAFQLCNGTCDDDFPSNHSASPIVTNLNQFQEDGTILVPEGSGFIGNSVALKAEVSDADSTAVALQVEVKPVGTDFDGVGIVSSATTTVSNTPFATTMLAVTVNNLITPQGNVPAEGIQQSFHWRVRALDGEGNLSEWVEFGNDPAAADFTVNYTLGVAAAELAKQVIHDPYLGDGKTWGGKGWDSLLHQYVNPEIIGRGYSFWNNSGQPPIGVVTGAGLDCSGLVEWSYDRSFDPAKSLTHNAVRWDGAGGQYLNNSTPTTKDALQPGDALFFGSSGSNGVVVSHVAMYTGNFVQDGHTFDMVEAASPQDGIIPGRIADKSQNKFLGYRKISIAPPVGGSVQAGSPIDLTVTDPDGFTISASTSIQTDEELLREVPGQLYYTESELGGDGHPEAMVYWPVSKAGAYKVKVAPMPNTTPDQTYSLTFTSGSSTIQLAQNVPLSQIPQNGYGIVVSSNGTPTLDTTPPEAAIAFSTSTKSIGITGSDNLSTTTVAVGTTAAVVSDAASNTLTLSITKNVAQSNYATLVIPSFAYSSGTSTTATTSARYFWLTDSKGKYTLVISAVKTPTDRMVSIYTSLTNKTYVVASQPSDDTDDLSLKTALLLLRQKLKTYNGLYIPSVSTHAGAMVIQ